MIVTLITSAKIGGKWIAPGTTLDVSELVAGQLLAVEAAVEVDGELPEADAPGDPAPAPAENKTSFRARKQRGRK